MKKCISIIVIWFVLSLACFGCAQTQSQSQNNQTNRFVTASGLEYEILKRGDGQEATAGKEIGLHGTGYFENGEMFWTTRETGDLFYFVLGTDSVIKGCDEGVALMRVGDRFKFTMKPELAYGDKEKSSIPPGSTLIFDYEIVSVTDPKEPIVAILWDAIIEYGIENAKILYGELKSDPAKYDLKENQLNQLGYKLLEADKKQEAIAILKLNVTAFPGSFNVYDSLGEAYMKDGQQDLAITNYKKSLELNPNNQSAKDKLQILSN